MIDSEKVIKGWECHIEADTLGCADCPYREGWRTCNFADTLYKDVYALLKEQEELLRKLQKDKDKLCLEVSEWKHKFHDAPPKFVSQGVVDQIRWERDTALSQLEQIGKGLGSKMDDIVSILKEQDAVEWINVKDKLPEKDGQYLVVYTFFNCKGMGVVRFTHNLHDIDEYIFDTESRPGWYESDDEVGYFERTTVTHWAKLPEFPKEGR